jgi:hypothetical protein
MAPELCKLQVAPWMSQFQSYSPITGSPWSWSRRRSICFPASLLPWFTFDNFRTPELQDRWSGLGHAGVFFINGRSGLTKYYEYGRYDKKGLGLVRKRSIPNVSVQDGQIVSESLRKPLHEISIRAGHGGRIEGV